MNAKQDTSNEAEKSKSVEASARLWLADMGRGDVELEPMAGDVSSRCYYRVHGAGEILAFYPPDLMRSYQCFLRSTELLLRAGVQVPEVRGTDERQTFMLTSDAGSRQVAEETDPALLTRAFDSAIEAAERIARLDPTEVASLSPALETELLTREMRQTCRVLFRQTLPQKASEELERLLYEVCAKLGAGRLVPAHRDFMARNLMLVETGFPAGGSKGLDLVVLDHQDLRLAPLGYDFASLFFDSNPLGNIQDSQMLDRVAATDERREALSRCAFQRCIKIAGTFISFSQRGQNRHLPKVGPALLTAAEQLRQISEADEQTSRLLEECAQRFDESLAC